MIMSRLQNRAWDASSKVEEPGRKSLLLQTVRPGQRSLIDAYSIQKRGIYGTEYCTGGCIYRNSVCGQPRGGMYISGTTRRTLDAACSDGNESLRDCVSLSPGGWLQPALVYSRRRN